MSYDKDRDQLATAEPVSDPSSPLEACMEGDAIHGGWFSVPLINIVQRFPEGGELWQGGCINGLKLPDDFDSVLSLYPWEKYKLGPSTLRVEVKMCTTPSQGFEQVEGLAEQVVACLHAGDKVLVHCQAGLNRSGLLAGTALKQMGLSGDEAVELLQAKRGTNMVLCNAAFERYVRGS